MHWNMSCLGGNAEWFCHVLLLDESEHPVEIQVSIKTCCGKTLEEILNCFD